MLAGARATVVPSDSENLSMVAVESMFAGTPVVVRDTVGVCDIVSRHGAGAIVSAEPAVIGRALARLVSDEASFSAAAAGAHAAAMEFSWDVVGDQFEQMEQWAARSTERERVMLIRGDSPR